MENRVSSKNEVTQDFENPRGEEMTIPVHWFDERPIKLESVSHTAAKMKWRVKDS